MADRQVGEYQAGALPALRRLLRAMNSYFTNKIEGHHTLPMDIERALHNDYAQDEDNARRQRLAACLQYEEKVVKQGARTEALRGLHYLFATQSDMERADFKAMLGLGDRLGTAQVSALLKRGLLESDSAYDKLSLRVPLHALRFYFPILWPEAEAGAG